MPGAALTAPGIFSVFVFISLKNHKNSVAFDKEI